jgi:hypothetical protein
MEFLTINGRVGLLRNYLWIFKKKSIGKIPIGKGYGYNFMPASHCDELA